MIKYDIISVDNEQGTLSVKYWHEDYPNDFIIKMINVPIINGEIDNQTLSLVLSQHCESVDKKLQIKRASKVSLDHLITSTATVVVSESTENNTNQEAPKKKRRKTVKVEETE